MTEWGPGSWEGYSQSPAKFQLRQNYLSRKDRDSTKEMSSGVPGINIKNVSRDLFLDLIIESWDSAEFVDRKTR
jgi:hypothetical protein